MTDERSERELIEHRLLRYQVFDEASESYFRWQLEAFRTPLGNRILEVGCGIGSITRLMGERELIVCLDVEREVQDYARERLEGSDFCQFRLLDINQCDDAELAELANLRFDTIVCMNVLEHVEEDQKMLGRCFDLLEPGGRLMLLVPAHPILYGKYDVHDGHFRRYSKRNLRAALKNAGFEVDVFRYFNAVGAIGWFVQYKLLRREVTGSAPFKLMGKLVPALRRIEGIIEPPFGISIIAVCRKPRLDG